MKLPKKADAMVGQDKDLNDSEEGYLNPEDLSIIDERTWEPSDEEILSYALKLGYDIEKDPDELFEVAYYYMKYPLPEGWKRAIYKKTKELMYINMEDGEIEVVTEIEEMAHQMYLEKKEEMIGKQLGILDKDDKKDLKAKNDKTKDNNKIPPLNPLKKSNSPSQTPSVLPALKDKSSSKNNLFNDIEKELNDKKNEKNDMGIETDLFDKLDKNKDLKKKNNDDIFGIIDNDTKISNKEKNEEKKENESDKKGIDIYGMHAKESEEEEEENEYGDEFDYDGIEDDSDLNKGEPLIKSMINKEKEKEEKERKEKEEKEKKEKELKEKLEKEEKERIEKEKREKEERELKEKREKEEKELQEKKERELKERKEKEERELREKREKEEKELKAKREKEEREEKEKREKLEKEKREKEEKLRKELEKEKELNDKLIKEKKEYLNKKLKELQEYKDQKKLKYEKNKKEKEEKNKKLKNEYDSKLQKDLNKNKSKIQSQFKEKLEFYESQLITKKSKEEKIYASEQKNIYDEKQKESKKKIEKEYEEKKSELKEKKAKLLKQINEEKKEKEMNESNIKEKKLKLQNNIKLLDEKKSIDVNNKNKKYELAIKEYEMESEKKLIKDKEQIKESITNNSNLLNYNSSSSNLNFSMSGINKDDENNEFIKSKLIENIQKSLDDEYELNCKEIEQEIDNNKIKEIEKYKLSLEQEKKDKIDFYKNEILSNEKEYYKILSNIRQNSHKKKLDGDNFLNVGLEQTINQHEEAKNKISQDNKKLMELVIEGIQKLIIQNNSIEQTELHIEEFLMELRDTYHLAFQKNKNVYEMAEYDYNHKKIFIKYLLDVINYLSKIFSSTNDMYDIDKKYIAENLLKFCKNKISDFKNKYQNKKKKRIYKFLNDNLLSKTQSYSNLSTLDDSKEANSIFVNSFKRKYDNDNINLNTNMNMNMNINIDNNKNESENILNKINVNESINNINKNSFIFKNKNNLLGSFNNMNTFNNLNNYNLNNLGNSNGFNTINVNAYGTLMRTKSLDDYNINEKFLKLLNTGNNNNMNKLEYFTVDQSINCTIPVIPEDILKNLNEDIIISYSEIILFLKNEYLKLIDISKENKNNNNKAKKNINLNKLILDKIKIYTEETFNYIINNYQNIEQQKNIQKKIQIVQNHIEDFKNNFNVDKYLENPNLYKTTSSAGFGKKMSEEDLVNNMITFNGQNNNMAYNKSEINGMNNLILNGNFNGFETK